MLVTACKTKSQPIGCIPVYSGFLLSQAPCERRPVSGVGTAINLLRNGDSYSSSLQVRLANVVCEFSAYSVIAVVDNSDSDLPPHCGNQLRVKRLLIFHSFHPSAECVVPLRPRRVH